MATTNQAPCKHWRVTCVRDGVEQWIEVKASRDEAIDREGDPPGPTEEGDLFRIDAPTPGAWSPRRLRLPIVGESAYDLAVKDALIAEGFGSHLFRGKAYEDILAYLSNKKRDPLIGLFWTIDQECDPYSITAQDLLDMRRDHVRRHPDGCEDDECDGTECEACTAAEDRAWGDDDDEPPCYEECTACDLENYSRLIDTRISAYVDQFLRGRGISARKHSCAVEFVPIDPPDAGGIYFVLGAGGCLKIGLAKSSIKRRIGELQTSHSVKLSLLAYEPTDAHRETEAAYHARFRDLRTVGEWFQFVGPLREFVKVKNIAHQLKKSEAA